MALTTLYFLLPLDQSSMLAAVTILAVGLVLLIALVVYQIRRVLSAEFPVLRAIESLAITVPFFLLLFAGIYLMMSGISENTFNQSLDHADALYFTVTVFATVGFGDIVATTQTAKLVVTVQMIADLVIIGVAIKATTAAVQLHRRQG